MPKESHPYVNDYHYHLQAAIYSLIREGGLPGVHQKEGYKFFCFSNIFPYGDFREGVERNLLVSSPDTRIIETIRRASISRLSSRDSVVVGEQRFAISSVSQPFTMDFVGPEVKVRSATPIVMRIPRKRYEEYGVEPRVDYDYVFWRETLPLGAFVKQLRDNMSKKLRDYCMMNSSTIVPGQDAELLPRMNYYNFIRTVSKPMALKGEKQITIGSLWELGFVVDNTSQAEVLRILLDCGFGERNSLGFGFLNLKSK